jgi:leucyl aminopeptidase
MKIHVQQGDIAAIPAEVIGLGVFAGVGVPGGAAGAVDRALEGAISALLHDGDFEGKVGETFLLRTEGKLPAKRVLLVGLGEQEELDLEVIRQVSAIAARAVARFQELATIVHGAGVGGFPVESAAQAVVEGTVLGAYRFGKYRREDSHSKTLERLQLVEFGVEKLSAAQTGAERGRLIAESVCFARDLANEPGAGLPPRELAERAQRLAAEFHLECRVLTEEELESEGMVGILGVARGSEEPPRLIVIEHHPHKQAGPPIVLIGKGVTFDSGGISIKPREGMEAMKYDMAGAAAVFGTLRAVAALTLPLHVIGLVPAVENLPSGKALKPGDILPYRNGKTVEVTNTDAEGRLILADALIYAERFRPRAVIDLATLTGACVVALGKEAAGLFGNDATLLERLKMASQRSGERVWELPLYEEYKKLIHSEIADIGNSLLSKGSTPQAGACVGAVFLQEFVHYPWAHLDIAGTAYDVDTRAYCPHKGATGYGVRLLTHLLLEDAR